MEEMKARPSPVLRVAVAWLSLAMVTGCNLSSPSSNSNDEKAANLSESFKPVILEYDKGIGFGIKSAQVSQNIKGTVFFMDKLNNGKSRTLEASGFSNNIDYNHIIACEKPCTLKVSKNKSGTSFSDDGTRVLRNGKFLLAGFRNPDFKGVRLEVVSKADNNRITAGIFQDAKISPGSSLSPGDASKVYGSPGNNIEVFDLPATLMYLGTIPVDRASMDRKAFPKQALLLASFNATGAFDRNRSYSGSYNKRYIAGTTTWSNHSWGAAIDLLTHNSNGAAMTYSQTASLVTPEMKDIASRLGIAWGGYWNKSFDPMHWDLIKPGF